MVVLINILAILIVLALFVFVLSRNADTFTDTVVMPKCDLDFIRTILNQDNKDQIDYALLRTLNAMDCIDNVKLVEAFPLEKQSDLDTKGIFVGVPTTNFISEKLTAAKDKYPKYTGYIDYLHGFVST